MTHSRLCGCSVGTNKKAREASASRAFGLVDCSLDHIVIGDRHEAKPLAERLVGAPQQQQQHMQVN